MISLIIKVKPGFYIDESSFDTNRLAEIKVDKSSIVLKKVIYFWVK